MRYFSFNEFDGEIGWVQTISEDEIRKEYYPYWQGKMYAKFGKEHVDSNYCFEDCVEDFKIIHWAWEVEG